jgi:hypothetical protein
VELPLVDNGHGLKPISIIKYSDKHGNSASGQEVSYAKDSNTTYTAMLQGQSRHWASLYALFSSKLEWEIARWAKTCGPSSTAVSNLLGIKGVSSPAS